jgi:agmatine deiminase
MITGKETNKVYLSEILRSDDRYSATCDNLLAILDKHHVPYDFLKGTKDIWCRDYMPIQVSEDKFVQFRYEPSYIKVKKDLAFRSDPREACNANGIAPVFSNINLDGGNVISWSDRVIISERIFEENRDEYPDKKKLVDDLVKLLEAEVIIIPKINCDMTGHADGMVRFVGRDTILGNSRDIEYKYWSGGINKVLKDKGIEYIDVPFFEHTEKEHPLSAIGVYVNYLEVKDLIGLPVFGVDGNKDAEVVDLFKRIFPNRTIETINYNAVANEGGLLNCTTWTVKEDTRP